MTSTVNGSPELSQNLRGPGCLPPRTGETNKMRTAARLLSSISEGPKVERFTLTQPVFEILSTSQEQKPANTAPAADARSAQRAVMRPRLLVVAWTGGSPSHDGHIAPDLIVRLHQGYVDHFDLRLALLGPFVNPHHRPLPPDCRVTYLPSYGSKWEYLTRRRRTMRILSHAIKRSDLVLAHIPSFHGVDALRLARRSSVPSVCLKVGIWEQTTSHTVGWRHAIFSRLARMLTVSAASAADLILAQGTAVESYLGSLGIQAIRVIETPLERDDFVERQPGTDNSSLRLLTISRLVPSKNLTALLEAIARRKEAGANLHLEVVGEGEERQKLETFRRRLDLDREVSFVGHVEDRQRIRELLSNANVFVLPSLTEGISWSILEAMAAGTPVIAAQVGGLPDILTDGQDALLVKTPTPQSLAEALRRLEHAPALRRQLGSNARERAGTLLHTAWVQQFRDIIKSRLRVGEDS